MEDDIQPLISHHAPQTDDYVKTHVYKRRWWIMIVFNLSSIVQTMVWNTWGPIAESSEIIFGWDDSIIAWLTNLDNISYIIFAMPITMFMDTKGLRASMLLCSMILVFDTAIRCFTFEKETFTILSYTCAFINGIAGPVPFAGPALVAAVWFPPHQRATATAIASFFNYFGIGMAFLLGPFTVNDPVYLPFPDHQDNSTDALNTNYSGSLSTNKSELYPEHMEITSKGILTNADDLKSGIQNLMYIHCGLAVLLCLLTIIYFPNRPPLPPSKTASLERTDYKQAFGKILRNGPLWMIVIAFSISIGVVGNWSTILDVNIKPLGVTQIDAGWMGFFNTLCGCLAGIIIAHFSERFKRRRKMGLIALFTCASVVCVWFSLLCSSYIAFNLPSLYISCILIGVFTGGSIPLFYEISAEASYPVAEGMTGGFMTLINCACGSVFLSMFSVPGIGTSWMNWCLLGSFLAIIPILIAFPEKFNRMDIDLMASK